MCTNFPWFLATIFFTNHWWDLDPYNLFGFGPLLCLRKFNDCKILKCLFRSSDGKTGVDKLRYIKNSYNKYKPPSRILKYSALYFLGAVNHSAPPPSPLKSWLWFCYGLRLSQSGAGGGGEESCLRSLHATISPNPHYPVIFPLLFSLCYLQLYTNLCQVKKKSSIIRTETKISL